MGFIFWIISFSKHSMMSLIFSPSFFCLFAKNVLFNVCFVIFLVLSLDTYIILFLVFFEISPTFFHLFPSSFPFFLAFYNCSINDSLILIFSVYYFAFPSNIFFGCPSLFRSAFLPIISYYFFSFESFAFLYIYQSL